MESGTSNTHLEDRVRTLEKRVDNTALSFKNICELLDGVQAAKSASTFHCCVNRFNNKIDCRTETIAENLGIKELTDDGRDICDISNTAVNCLPD